MTPDAGKQIIHRLDTLLESEREALLQGDLRQIATLVASKEALIDDLNGRADASTGDLAAIQAKVLRNQALLDGALQGIRNVAARLAAFRQVRRAMETYDRAGQKRTIPGVVERRVEKRA